MASRGHIAYLTIGEDLNNPLLRRQVLELLCEMKRIQPNLQVTLFSFLTFPAILNHRKGLKYVRDFMGAYGIKLKIIPSLVPWPLPHLKFRKTDVGYRPNHVWDESAIRFLGLVVWPVLFYYHLFRGVRVFHCRSYPPGYVAIMFKKLFPKVRIIFDPRSDFPEENVTAGNWELGDQDYSFWKKAELLLLRHSDAIACIAPSYERTYKTIYRDINCFLVPNNVDWKTFQRNEIDRKSIRKLLGIKEDDLLLCYVGAITSNGWNRASVYAHVCESFSQANIKCHFLFIIPPHGAGLLRSLLSLETGKKVTIISPSYENTPSYLSAADYGMIFMHKKTIRVGTKTGEYLAAGLPVIANRNCIGAYELINEKGVGILIGMGLGDLDTIEDLESIRSIASGDSLKKWSSDVSSFARNYFDNSGIAARYCEQYMQLVKCDDK